MTGRLPPSLAAHRLLADGQGLALLRPDGEVDWWCLPDPDASPVLWSLLDPQGGRARWAGVQHVWHEDVPAGPLARTVLRVDAGNLECVDGLLGGPDGAPAALVRLVRASDRDVVVTHDLRLAPFPSVASPALRMRVDGSPEQGAGNASLALVRGRWRALVLGLSPLPDGSADQLLSRLEEQDRRLSRRLGRALLPREHPQRSADALRVLDALTMSGTGAVLASPTTSLPEAVPGDRSFDYRYAWLRDASLAVSVASLLGAHDSARGFLAFAQRVLGDDPLSAAPVVTLDGRPVPEERVVPDVAGWAGAGPVRLGNGAGGQVQHDALGLFVESVSVHVQAGGSLPDDVWASVRAVADALAARVLADDEPASSGIWELREPHQLVSEDVGRWVALDRAVWLARGWRPTTRRRNWLRARDRLRSRVLGAQREDGSLPMAYGEQLPGPDAASLLVPLLGMCRDERAVRLVRRVLADLGTGPYLRRYPPGPLDGTGWDGFRGREGAFLPVSFMAVGALAAVGELGEARARMDALCARLPRLLAEMVDPDDERLLGNVPLLWSHMELVRALYLLDVEQRRARWGSAGLAVWRLGRYLRLRHAGG